MNFWQEIKNKKQPFFCVAPMADVTDPAFRRLIAKYGKPDVMWTEFVSANGLMSGGRKVLQRDLEFSEIERPIVAQLFSADPDNMEKAARLCAELGFDGIDINMGCPDKTIEKQGAGAAMIKSPEVAVAIIAAAKRGAGDIPVSVKTRVGYNAVEIQEWISLLLQQDIAALTVHVRTRKELSKVPAHWEYLKEVVALRDAIAPQTVIIGNGDVTSLTDGRLRAAAAGADGVMVGRALFGNPWFFDEYREMVASIPKKSRFFSKAQKIPFFGKYFQTRRTAAQSAVQPISIEERLSVMVEHTQLFEQLLGDIKSFSIMKKHYKAYCTGFAGAKELRIKLMDEAKNAADVEVIVKHFFKNVL
ncbi:MAG: tRNA-dihydrouridine synthase [Candidatus Nomurabacteria bacterium]|jgi:nifR3 family TIM-barrel protein|nr:tRNA-dihydrouridine synthase [Candidatus Nomurabacteria bacterium]